MPIDYKIIPYSTLNQIKNDQRPDTETSNGFFRPAVVLLLPLSVVQESDSTTCRLVQSRLPQFVTIAIPVMGGVGKEMGWDGTPRAPSKSRRA